MRTYLAAAAVLLLTQSALAIEPEDIRREFEGAPIQGEAVTFTSTVRLPLPQLLDQYFNTGLSFDADGVKVQMSGGSVEKKPFVLLAPAGGEPVLVDGDAIIFGSRVVTLNGGEYELSVGINLFHKKKSHVHVDKLMSGDTRKRVLDPTINDIVNKGYEACGADIMLGGKPYKFSYGRKIARSGDTFSIVPGTFASFLYKDGDKVTPTPLPEIAAIRAAPQTMTVGGASLRLSMDAETLVIEDASAPGTGQLTAPLQVGFLGAAL